MLNLLPNIKDFYIIFVISVYFQAFQKYIPNQLGEKNLKIFEKENLF